MQNRKITLADIEGALNEHPTTDVASAMKEMTEQNANALKAMLTVVTNQQGFFQTMMQQQHRQTEKLVDRLLAQTTPIALERATRLERAGAAAVAPKPPVAAQVSPDDGGGAGSDEIGTDAEELARRQRVDDETILASTERFSGSGFQPPG